ncbi:MAG TPA: hypothetical protein VGC55_08275 [Dokdonella sp.]
MKSSIVLALLFVTGVNAAAADADGPKYAPGIIGRLTRAGQPMASANVCLRSAGTEIRQCAYADFDGRFYLPTLGAVQPQRADGVDTDTHAIKYPVQWLELGIRGDAVTRLYPVELVDGRKSMIRLDCDMVRHPGQAGDEPRYCEIAPERAQAEAQARR